ncbi:hypothetical protein RQP46_001601 [Phenoliferia psychrophenolica]
MSEISWQKECHPYIAILDPAYDTYESLRRRSAFLFNTVIFTASRAQGGNLPPSKELTIAAEETKLHAHSASSGRPLVLSDAEIDVVERNVDKLLSTPLRIPDDVRTVANVKVTILERKIIAQGAALSSNDRVAYVRSMQPVLNSWYSKYDLILDAPPDIVEMALDALRSARECISTVLHSPAYSDSIKYSAYLTRVDLSFACLLSMRLASAMSADLVPDRASIAADVLKVANIISDAAPGTLKYSSALRVARDQFLAKISSSTLTGWEAFEGAPFDPYSSLGAADVDLLGMSVDWSAFPSNFLDMDFLDI